MPEIEELDDGGGSLEVIHTSGEAVNVIFDMPGDEGLEIRLTSDEIDWLITALRSEQQRI